MLLQGHKLGKYTIIEPLGSGGFGAVYRARDTWINKDVALKVPHRQNLNFSELLREPRLLAALDHPNVVSITTAEKQENIFFIVMEYIKGETLENIIAKNGALDVTLALDYACQICEAVEHAHQHGIIHRDLRPPNVLIADSGILKVADFGTSRFLEIAAQGTTLIGSPAYMAPEQFEGKTVLASDLYSLGVTMYQMLTGVLPYETPTPSNLNKLMRGELVKTPGLHNPLIPRLLDDLIMKAMSPSLAGRYQNATELLSDLRTSQTRSSRIKRTSQETTKNLKNPSEGSAKSDNSTDHTKQLDSPNTPSARFCWKCNKPLHSRAGECPFCGEIQ